MRILLRCQIISPTIGGLPKPFAGSNRMRRNTCSAWEMVEILERNDVLVWQIKGRDVGDIYYEDEAQVFARPKRAVRRLLRR